MINKIIDKYGKKEEEFDYDPFARPPDFQLAKNHASAVRFANPSESEKSDKCPCCGFCIAVDEISLLCDRQDMNINGPGVPLYFEYLIFSIIILVVLGYYDNNKISITQGIYTTIINQQGNRCDANRYTNKDCDVNYFNVYSLSNRTTGVDQLQLGLDLIATVFIIAITIFYRRYMNLTVAEVDRAVISISDFSIQVNNLPKDATVEEIKQFFSSLGKQKNKLQVEQVCLGYNILYYVDLMNQKYQSEAQLSNLLKSDVKDNELQQKAKKQIEQRIATLNNQIDLYESDFEKQVEFSGVAFVTFNTSNQAKAVRKYFNLSRFQLLIGRLASLFMKLDHLKFRNNIIEVYRAPEPGDVIWENLGYDAWSQLKRQSATNFVTIILLGACFGIILGISAGQNAIKQANTTGSNISTSAKLSNFMLGIVASIIITIINILLRLFIKRLVSYEKLSTSTEMNVSLAIKLGIAQFLNTAIITLLVNVVFADETGFLTQIWVVGGLNQGVSIMLIANASLPWLLSFFDPWYGYKLYQRHKNEQLGSECKLTQKQANEIFEGQVPDLSGKYSAINKTLMFTFFYAQLLPIAIPLAVGQLVITYWVDKYLFLKRYQKGPPIGSQLANEMVDFYIELSLVLYASGNCIWQKTVYQEIHPIAWVQLALSLLQLILPIDGLLANWLEVEEAETLQSYQQCKNTLWDDFMRRNPVTMEKAIEEWMNQGSDNKQNEEAKQKMLEKLRITQNKKKAAQMERAFKANEAEGQTTHHKIVDEETIHFVNKVVPQHDNAAPGNKIKRIESQDVEIQPKIRQGQSEYY